MKEYSTTNNRWYEKIMKRSWLIDLNLNFKKYPTWLINKLKLELTE